MPTPQVDGDETLIRQLTPKGNPIWFDPAREPLVHYSAFLPSKWDIDGLSMLRNRYRAEIWCAYRPNKPDVRYLLARLKLGDLELAAANSLSIGTKPCADDLDLQHGEPWSHFVVPEISRAAYDGERHDQIVEWALAVSSALSDRDIVPPFSSDPIGHPYRP